MLFLLNVFGVGVLCRVLCSIVGYLYASSNGSITLDGEERERELIYLLLVTCKNVVSAGEVSSSSG